VRFLRMLGLAFVTILFEQDLGHVGRIHLGPSGRCGNRVYGKPFVHEVGGFVIP
jgi:hypothetical protein